VDPYCDKRSLMRHCAQWVVSRSADAKRITRLSADSTELSPPPEQRRIFSAVARTAAGSPSENS